jgi:hypothetical protein
MRVLISKKHLIQRTVDGGQLESQHCQVITRPDGLIGYRESCQNQKLGTSRDALVTFA